MSIPSHQRGHGRIHMVSAELRHRIASAFRPAAKPEACRVCSCILDMVRKASNERSFDYRRLGNVHRLMNAACPHADSMQRLWESVDSDDKGPPHLSSVEVHCADFIVHLVVLNLNENYLCSRRVDLVAKLDRAEHLGTSRLIDSQWVDVTIPRSWYDACVDEHGLGCVQPLWMTTWKAGTAGYPEWLIDTEDLCIVPFDSSTATYFTLSYTWGGINSVTNTNGALETLRKPNSLHPDHITNMPRTVRDAMNITKSLGERYLWVDRLCIIQDDQTALARSLNVMHKIYANSAVCLVALAGKDADHGLRGFPGVSESRCVEQGTFNMAGGDQLSWFNRPLSRWELCEYPRGQVEDDPAAEDGSTWNERGWTFQEFIFARRRLVFTDGPLRWVCSRGDWREEAHKTRGNDFVVDKPFVKWMERPCPSLKSLVGFVASDFNKRYFRVPEDAPRAFLGVQNFIGSYFQGGLIYGHPEMFFDNSLLWQPRRNMERRIASTALGAEEGILPSWSWLGWHGTFYFTCDNEYEVGLDLEDGFVEPVAEWFAMKSPTASPSERRPINSKWHHYKTLAQEDAEQLPEGWKRFSSTSGSPHYEFGGRKFLYPVPIPSSTDAAEPTVQLPFLFARTTRASFALGLGGPSMWDTLLAIQSTSQEFVGYLVGHNKADVERLLMLKTVELVAVAKGWSMELDMFTGKAPPRAGADRDEGSRRPGERGSPRPECYFVLCIAWENGVAKRQAAGKVHADAWEMAQEPMDLILG